MNSLFGNKPPNYGNIGLPKILGKPSFGIEDGATVTKADVLKIIQSEISRALSNLRPSERVVETKTIVERPKEVVREIIKEVFKKDEEMDNEVQTLKKTTQRIIDTTPVPGGPGVIGVPIPDNQQGKILKTDGRRIYWDFAAGQTDGTTLIPLGDQTQNGSWRLLVSGTNLSVQRLESGVWTEKGAFLS